MITEENKKDKQNYVDVPFYGIKLMTDDEWNRLAYINWLNMELKREVVTRK